ncbi:MAG TPA: G1 family glutamic endopeptidase [Patescibacteria group bacterium]|nr:G1 family glutamic endopeptidase [Patescibacteria group bacterium]
MKITAKISSGLFVVVFAAFALLGLNPGRTLAQTVPPSAINSGAGSDSSYNWAGYVATGGGYTAVSGSWTVPQVQSTGGFSGDATWIGLGGISSNDLIQTGTQAIVQNGSVSYQAWYELLPAYSQPVSLAVTAGDSISAGIAQAGNNIWTITLRNNTTGQSYQTTVNYISSLSSAEWIEEMPSQGNNNFIPLDNFGTVQLSGAYASRNGQNLNLAQLSPQTLTMVNFGGQALAAVSAINSDGASFSVSRTTASSSSGITTIPYGRRGSRRVGRGLRLPSGQNRPSPEQGLGLGLNGNLRSLIIMRLGMSHNLSIGW